MTDFFADSKPDFLKEKTADTVQEPYLLWPSDQPSPAAIRIIYGEGSQESIPYNQLGRMVLDQNSRIMIAILDGTEQELVIEGSGLSDLFESFHQRRLDALMRGQGKTTTITEIYLQTP